MPSIIPAYIKILDAEQQQAREFLFPKFAAIVRSVKQSILEYVPLIFDRIDRMWDQNISLTPSVLELVDELAILLRDGFSVYIPRVMKHVLYTLNSEHPGARIAVKHIFNTIAQFGKSLDEQAHVILPRLAHIARVGILDSESNTNPAVNDSVRRAAVHCIGRLVREIDITDYASLLIHTVIKFIESHSMKIVQSMAIKQNPISEQTGTPSTNERSALASSSGHPMRKVPSTAELSAPTTLDDIDTDPLCVGLTALCSLVRSLDRNFRLWIPTVRISLARHVRRLLYGNIKELANSAEFQTEIPTTVIRAQNISSAIVDDYDGGKTSESEQDYTEDDFGKSTAEEDDDEDEIEVYNEMKRRQQQFDLRSSSSSRDFSRATLEDSSIITSNNTVKNHPLFKIYMEYVDLETALTVHGCLPISEVVVEPYIEVFVFEHLMFTDFFF